jgi:GT2 family glycosyltransferase
LSKNDPLLPGAGEQDFAARTAAKTCVDPTHAPAPQDVVVVIVNYGTADLTLEAVGSVLDRASRVKAIHVVDNASPAKDGPRLAAAIAAHGWEGRVTLWAESLNHGFGRGNNLVIDRVLQTAEGGDKIFLLNPDARLENDAVGILADFLDAHPKAGAAGAQIAQPQEDGLTRPVTAAFRFPSLASVFSDAVSFGPISRLFTKAKVALDPNLPSGEVDWVAGAAVMFRRETLKAVGGFDPAFFLYFEEVELMHRIRQAGWEVWYRSDARVIHAEGAATGVKSGVERRRRPGYWYQSWAYYMRKTQGRLGGFAALGLWLLGAGLNWGISRLRGRAPAMPLHFFGDVLARAPRVLWTGRIEE